MARPRPRPRPRSTVSDSLSSYLQEIGAYALLTAEQEAALAHRAQAGDSEALDALVCANLRFVVAIAKRYRWQGSSLEDVISDGNVGLVRAARRFDPSRGTRFTTYAIWWIRQAIDQGLAEQAGIARLPVERVSLLRRVGRRARGLTQELGREPTQREVAADVDAAPAELEQLLAVTRGVLSLDAPPAGTDDAPPLERLADPEGGDLGAPMMQRGLASDLEAALTTLPVREAHTLRLAFGLDGEEPRTLLEIGQTLGVTRERARQIKVLALEHLRHHHTGRRLAAHRF